jgi:hypothetical protein
VPDLREILDDPRRAALLSATEAAALLVKLASLQAAVAAQLTIRPADEATAALAPQGDRLLTADEVAERFQRSVDWVSRQAKHWSFTRRLTRRTLRFSEAGLAHFLATTRRFAR